MSLDGRYAPARGGSHTNRESLSSSEMPSVCETCLGDPYVRMSKHPYASIVCKFCNQPYTSFSWRVQGRSLKTEICSQCSTLKNLCQVCIRDLKFGLPSQLRDAVLSHSGDVVCSQSANISQQLQFQIIKHQGTVVHGLLTQMTKKYLISQRNRSIIAKIQD